jgi:Uma2 family endonuclease
VEDLITEDDGEPEPLPPEDWPNVDHLVTEDDIPVDNIPSEKLQRLLTEPLYSSWPGPGEERPFLAAANVGLFFSIRRRPLVPDVFLSLDVQVADDWWAKSHRSYFFWEFGKPPEVAIEVVSNTKGGEDSRKLLQYARMGILYYVIWDPSDQLKAGRLRVFVLRDGAYTPLSEPWFPVVGLGLCAWQGTYEGKEDLWLRWCDREGQPIPTGAERAEQAVHEKEQAERAHEEAARRAEQAEREREQAARRAELLAARLRAAGIDPDA